VFAVQSLSPPAENGIGIKQQGKIHPDNATYHHWFHPCITTLYRPLRQCHGREMISFSNFRVVSG
jgi:hypothetical protein